MENKNYFDKHLGNYYYDGAWILEKVVLFEENELPIVFQAFEEEPISDSQRNMYDYFIGNKEAIFEKVLKLLEERFGKEYKQVISFGCVYFNRFDEFGFLIETIYDRENGIAVKLSADNVKTEIGEQNILI